MKTSLLLSISTAVLSLVSVLPSQAAPCDEKQKTQSAVIETAQSKPHGKLLKKLALKRAEANTVNDVNPARDGLEYGTDNFIVQ